jgi:hypothetical protein
MAFGARKLTGGARGRRGEDDDSISWLTRVRWVARWPRDGSEVAVEVEAWLEVEERVRRAVASESEYGGDPPIYKGQRGCGEAVAGTVMEVEWPPFNGDYY